MILVVYTTNGQDAERLLIVSSKDNVMDEHGPVLLRQVDLIIPHVPVVQWFVPMDIAMVLSVCCMDLKGACVKTKWISVKFVA